MPDRKRLQDQMGSHLRAPGTSPPASSPRRSPSSQPPLNAINSIPAAVDFARRPEPRNDSAPAASSRDKHRSRSVGSSNAQQRFDQTNSNPQQSNAFHASHGAPDHISGPLQHGSEAPPSLPYNAFPTSLMQPFRGQMQHMHEQSVEAYRSVIDDLTVRNKALKAKLKQYEEKQQQLDSEKLIEIKFHGLSAAKKRELEKTLQSFVHSIEQPSNTNISGATSETTNLVGLSTIAKPRSSNTSTRFADSGYDSLATSSQALSQRNPKKPSSGVIRLSNGSVDASQARDRSIQSYLHDIPEGLMPRQSPAVMTETTRKKLIVARLEQLFSGRGAAIDGHQQPIQQQEVSQLAARDDRSAIEAQGQRAAAEGKREAPIMTKDADDSLESRTSRCRTYVPTDADARVTKSIPEEHEPIEQRPTRPLDLDPHRAQDPCENVEYLRHLGFSKPEDSDSKVTNAESDWLYLNLVMNMAQLHTLNVTSKLVKDAINDYSSKFELSTDGRKLRWRTQPLLKPLKSDSLEDISAISANTSISGHGRKRMRHAGAQASVSMRSLGPSMGRGSTADGSSGRSRHIPPYQSQPGASEVVDDTEMLDYMSQPSCAAAEDPPTYASSAWSKSANLRSHPPTRTQKEDGPIIFYKQEKFFTDLSGDRAKPVQLRSSYNVRRMRSLGQHFPGLSRESAAYESATDSIEDTTSHASLDVNADANSIHDGVQSDAHRKAFLGPSHPIPFEASGIGCVYPTDNFVLYVTREVEQENTPPLKRRKLSKLQEQVTGSHREPNTSVAENILLVRVQLLDPSPLPPPLFAVSDDGSESGSEDEEKEDASYEYTAKTPSSEHDHLIVDSTMASEEPTESGEDAEDAAADLQDAEEEYVDDSASSMSSNNFSEPSADAAQKSRERINSLPDARMGRPAVTSKSARGRPATTPSERRSRSPSFDLLASARQADPEVIREREREYDAEMAERLAEEMPVGSSAAACGGQLGSGNNTPSPEEMEVDAYEGFEDERIEEGESMAS